MTRYVTALMIFCHTAEMTAAAEPFVFGSRPAAVQRGASDPCPFVFGKPQEVTYVAAPAVVAPPPFVRSGQAVTTPATTVRLAGQPNTSFPASTETGRTGTPVRVTELFGATSGCANGRCESVGTVTYRRR